MLDGEIRCVIPQVFQVPIRRTSLFFLLDRRVTVVDCGLTGSAPRMLKALRLLGRSPEDVEYIVITHYHPDHAGGLAGLQRFVPARTAVHAAESAAVRGERSPPEPLHGPAPALLVRPAAALFRVPPARVDIPLTDGDELPVLGGLRAVHTPGHTPGHIVVHLRERGLVIAGDALQVRGGGRITPPHMFFTQDRAEAARSIAKIAALDFDVLAFSHFPPQRDGIHERLRRLARDAVRGRTTDERR